MPKKEKITKQSENQNTVESYVDKFVNIVMVGDDGIGKTCIIDSYVYDTFNTEYVPS